MKTPENMPMTLADELVAFRHQLEQVREECGTWKSRAEAAERDIRDLLVGGIIDVCHYCKQDTKHDGIDACDDLDCAYAAEWRGPCAENGGVDDGN